MRIVGAAARGSPKDAIVDLWVSARKVDVLGLENLDR